MSVRKGLLSLGRDKLGSELCAWLCPKLGTNIPWREQNGSV